MLCRSVAKCADLSACQDEEAVLHIGEAEQDFGDSTTLSVKFTDLATNRVTVIEGEYSVGPPSDITISMTDFAPVDGHHYKVEVVGQIEGGGIFPVQFKPYELSGDAFDITDTAYDHVLVTFVKVNGSTASEQWLSLPV